MKTRIMGTIDYDDVVRATLKGINPFRDIQQVRQTFEEWKSDYEVGKFYMAHVIARFMPDLVTVNNIEDALVVATMMFNGYYALINACCNDDVRTQIILYFNNRYLNAVSIVDAITTGMISTDLATTIIRLSLDNGNLTLDDLDIIFATMSEQALSLPINARGNVLLMMTQLFADVQRQPTVPSYHKTIMARSVYDVVKNIDVDIFGMYLVHLDVEDYFAYVTTEQYQLLKDYKTVSEGTYY